MKVGVDNLISSKLEGVQPVEQMFVSKKMNILYYAMLNEKHAEGLRKEFRHVQYSKQETHVRRICELAMPGTSTNFPDIS